MLKKILAHYLIPHEKNNHRAAALKPNFLLLLIAFYLFSQSLIKSLVVLNPGVLGYSSEITTQKVLDQTNEERKKAGLEPYTYNSVLSASAKAKAEDMFKFDYWSHNSPQGKTPWTFFDAAGYQYTVAGENLAKDFYNTDSLMKAWMNSPTHKANIVHQKYKEIGIAVVNGTLGGIKTTLVVQHFGTPAVAPIKSTSKVSKDIVEPEAAPVEEKAVTEVVQSPSVLSQNSEKMVSPLAISKILSSIIFIALVIILFVDGFITIKKNIHRMTGSTVGHIGFLLFILLLMLYNQQGSIF